MFRSDVLVRQALGFLGCIGEDSFALLRERQIDRGRNLFADGRAAFDLLSDGFDRAVGTEETVGQSLVLAQKAQQEVFGFNVGTSELAGFVSRKKDNASGLLGVSLKHG